MQGVCLPFPQSSNCSCILTVISQDMPGYVGVMNNCKNISDLRQLRFVFRSAPCPLKITWGCVLYPSLCLLENLPLHASMIAKAGLKTMANPWSFYLKPLLRNEPIGK